MKIRNLIFVFFLVILSSCTPKGNLNDDGREVPVTVSLVALVSNPSKYHDQRICVQGALTPLGGGGYALFISSEDLYYRNMKNAFSVYFKQDMVGNLPKEPAQVIICGLVKAPPTNDDIQVISAFSGELIDCKIKTY